jgi:hypothetical protein
MKTRRELIGALTSIRDIAAVFGDEEHSEDCPARDPETDDHVGETEDEDMQRCECLPGALERIYRLANREADQ